MNKIKELEGTLEVSRQDTPVAVQALKFPMTEHSQLRKPNYEVDFFSFAAEIDTGRKPWRQELCRRKFHLTYPYGGVQSRDDIPSHA